MVKKNGAWNCTIIYPVDETKNFWKYGSKLIYSGFDQGKIFCLININVHAILMNKKTCSSIIISAVIALGIIPSVFIIKAEAQQTIDITAADVAKPSGGEKIGTLTIEPNGHTIHITANVSSASY